LSARTKVGDAISQFFFDRQSDQWLAVLRIGLAAEVLLYCLSLSRDWNYFFAAHGGGLISRQASEILLSSESAAVPRLSWLIDLATFFHVNESTALFLIWLALLDVTLLLLFGLFCREAAVATWFIHLAAVKSGGLLSYGVDNFTTIGLFYLMLSPLPDRWSIDHRSRKIPMKDRQLHGFFRRTLQVHLCLIYFFGGLAKCLGPGWWTGESIWRALTHPPFNVISPEILVRFRLLFPVASISATLLELAYPIFIWPSFTRRFWLTAILAMHISIGLTMGMYLFAFIMLVLNLAAFGPGALWRENLATSDCRSYAKVPN
jgi:hypothetical protein